MRKTQSEKINDYICPHCNQKLNITAYYIISSYDTPELLEKILDKSLFEHICPHCNKKIIAQYDMTYFDNKDDFNVSVYWNNPEELTRIQQLERAVRKGYIHGDKDSFSFPNYEDLIIKIHELKSIK